MLNPAVAQKLLLFALCVAGLLLAVFLGTLIVVVASVSLFSGGFFWVLTIASSFLSGTFPILGGSFTPFQILMAIGVAKFLLTDTVLKRTRIQWPARADLHMIIAFMAIITLHGVHDRFGMKFLGSSIWGGRNYVNVFVGLAAFFVIMSIPMSAKLWARLPYVVLGVSLFDLTIAVITKIVPSSVYVIYPFYSAVSTASLEEIVTGSPDITGRVGAFGNFGFILITLVLASISLPQILHPSNFFRLIALVAGSISVIYSGFRSAVFNTLTVAIAAGIRDLKFAVLAFLPVVAIGLFAISFINSEIVTLPKQMQRSLTFLPGKWDPDMVMDANGSNDFRWQVWTLWLKDYFPAQPFLGRGFGFKSQWAEKSVYKYNPNSNREAIETGNIHNGFLAALDCFGIIGTIFFVIWNFRLLVQTFKVGRPENEPGSFTLRFIALYLAAWIVCYWIGAQDVGSFLPREFALAGVFLRLQREGNVLVEAPTSSAPKQGQRVGTQFAVAKG